MSPSFNFGPTKIQACPQRLMFGPQGPDRAPNARLRPQSMFLFKLQWKTNNSERNDKILHEKTVANYLSRKKKVDVKWLLSNKGL